jgi:hypothetical protein
MKHSAFILIVLLSFAGCSVSVTVMPEAPPGQEEVVDYHHVNTMIADRSVHLTLANGSVCDAGSVHLAPDSTSFLNEDKAVITIPTRSICKLELQSRTGGAAEGFMLGLCGGGLFGYGFGYSFCNEVHDDFIRGAGVAASTTLGALLGSIGGLTQGAVHGHRTEYIFKHPSH